MKKETLVAVVLMGLLCVGVSASTVVTLQHGSNGVTVKEGHVRSSHVDRNFGGSTSLQVGGLSSQLRYGMVEFNHIFGSGTGQVPLNQTVVNATLRLYAANVVSQATGSPVQDKFRLHPLAVDVTSHYGSGDGNPAAAGEMCWSYRSSNTVGWGSAGTGNSGPVYGQDYRIDAHADTYIHTDDDQQWIEWDVTAIVQAWLDHAGSAGGYENFGFFLRNVGDYAIIPYFNTTNLTSGTDPELVVEYVPEPATVTLLALAGLGLWRRRR